MGLRGHCPRNRMPLTPLPETITFNLTFQNGIERTDCRKKHRHSKVDEGYETLKGRIRQAARLTFLTK